MSHRDHLSEFEHMVLVALVRREGVAYGMQIRREIEGTSDRGASIGTVYSTLERLEEKELVSSWREDPDPVRGGHPRRYFRIEREGLEALARSKQQFDLMWKGVTLDLDGGS